MHIQPVHWLSAIALTVVLFSVIKMISRGTARHDLKRAENKDYSIFEFRKLKPKLREDGKRILLQEHMVKSLSHRYLGRFDAAVVHWCSEPVLDVVVERKFPSRYLPDKVREEDVFQAGLYALAIKESGFKCTSTQLVVSYCLQDIAESCLHNNKSRDCWDCSRGRFFEVPFKPDKVVKHLQKLNEIWYEGREPRPASVGEKCIQCPHSQSGRCNYAQT